MKKEFWITLLLGLTIVIAPPLMAGQSWAETALSGTPNSSAQVQTVVPDDVQWTSSDIAGVESAVALGDLSSSALYVLFGKMDNGTVFPSHTHPDARITTVISGMMYYGVGEQFDRTKTKLYPAGSVVYTPAGTPHFMYVQDDETVMQETGFGPTGITFTTNGE
ncbi:MAG: cupin domain-containing protein [Cyanobacteria bacterium J06621_11]